MQTLKEKLEQSTQELLSEYLLKTTIYCENKFKEVEEKASWSYEKWMELYSVPLGYMRFDRATGTKVPAMTLSKSGDSKRNEISSLHRMGYEKFLERELKLANLHYQQSLDKLVYRLEQKGIVGNEFEVAHQRLGVNFEVIINLSNGNVVKAWTIIAEGPIIRPHYRFLVK